MLLQVSLWRLQLAFLNKRTNQDCIPFRKEASVIRYPRNVVFNHHGSTCGLGLESSDAVLCITCAQARSHNKLNWSLNMDLAFLSTGFSNWKMQQESLHNTNLASVTRNFQKVVAIVKPFLETFANRHLAC